METQDKSSIISVENSNQKRELCHYLTLQKLQCFHYPFWMLMAN